jgi:hypothetical protein
MNCTQIKSPIPKSMPRGGSDFTPSIANDLLGCAVSGCVCRGTWSRFQLNVTAGSQKRAIANLRKSEGRDESHFALKLKRNLDFNCKSRSLSILCDYSDE